MTVNGCGWQWGLRFSMIKNWVKKVKFFNPDKVESLYYDIETLCCNPHDEWFSAWWGITDFYKANMSFINNLLALLHWTTIFSRIIIFVVFFFGLNILGVRYFKFTKLW